MAFVQFSRINLSFADRNILNDVSLRLAAGSRSCLTGANGSGKSTLMKIIADKIQADSGERSIQKNTRISYLPQSGIVHHGKSLREEAETAFYFVHTLIERLEKIGEMLEKTNENKSDNISEKNLIEEHHLLQEQIENLNYYRREADIYSVFTGLGFSIKDMERNTGEFSGGWQMRIALAKMLLEKPDILLLDEPTNYLDIEARYWLEKWLSTFSGGYLLVSHDRYFLDVCVNEVYELFNGSLKRYAGNYTSFENTRKIELASLVKRHEEQQEEIIKTQALIKRFRYKASKASFAQELIKRLEKMEHIEIPESLKKINITFPPVPHCGNIALTLEGIGKCYGQRQVLSSLDLILNSSERLVVAGPNGAGKSTLLRIIAGIDNNFEGNIKYGSGIKHGYFSQDAAEALSTTKTIIEFMEEEASLALIPKLRDMLGAFLFRGDDIYKNVSVLSGGEKSRLALLKMFLKPMNLLILDEPTNHLDLYSKDILLEALKNFTGTIIFVSHDRAFMEALSTKTLELQPGENLLPARAKLFYGNYSYYLEKIEREDEKKSGQATVNKEKPAVSTPSSNENNIISNEQRRIAEKQRQSNLRKLEKKEAEILKELETLENEKSRLETELSKPLVYSNSEKAKAVKQQLDECILNIEAKTHQWEEIASQLEEIN
ncbi:MAG: ABC-F family ATP-binding cassette domain-containing protein [Treponema sp.]|nr:ABC-F family ATP-binding cassette domain-containing protein [Treponema sp.]MCL2251011.1 ABC-F family ATP-binding cassette domain-containing protein [Treponema sp.]